MKRSSFALLILAWPSTASAAEPLARAVIENKGQIVAGQQVRLDVDILVPDFFTSPPQFPLFEVPNALVTLPEEPAENVADTVNGVRYSGIRKAYAIIPQTSGTFTMPAIAVDLGHSVEGKPTKATVTVPSVTFEVSDQASSPGKSLSFAARKLTLAQSFDRDLHSLKAGDAVVRTITISAEDTQAIVMPAVDVGTAAGLHQYAKAPRIEDGISDGRRMVSRRTETYVYTVDNSGNFTIPAVSYGWFDVADRQARVATLPAIPLSIAAAAERQTAIKPVLDEVPAESPWIRRRRIAAAILIGLALLSIAYIARGIPAVFARAIERTRDRRLASFAHRLKLLRKAIADGEEKDIYRSLHAWSSSLGYRTLEEWAKGGSNDLRREVGILSERLFASGRAQLDRKALAAGLDVGRGAVHPAKPILPPLNPDCAPNDETNRGSPLPPLVATFRRAC